MRLIVITGGAGFIGSNIAARMAGSGEMDLAVCDRLRDVHGGKWRNLLGVPLRGIVPPEELFPWLERYWRDVAAVVHMAAVSSTTEPDVDHILAQNFRLSQQLWDWCAIRQRPLVYASSAAVYGAGEQGFVDQNEASAVAALRPLNPYGWSKQLFDLYALRAAARGQAPPRWAGLRFFNVYGPNEAHKRCQRSVAAQMFEQIAAGEHVRLFRSHRSDVPDGGQQRDFVSVKDCVAVIEWLLRSGVQGGIVNVGSGSARSFRDLAEATFSAMDRRSEIDWVDIPQSIQNRYQYFTEADLTRLRSLGYSEPMASLEEGIAEYGKAWRMNLA